MSKPWWMESAPETADRVGRFLDGWAKDRVGDVKAGLGIRDPNNRRDGVIRAEQAAKKGQWEDFEAELKDIDPNSLSPDERERFRGYSRSAKSAAESKEQSRMDQTYERFYGDEGYRTKDLDRQFARATAMNRENIAAQKDLANIGASTSLGVANIGAQANRDVANISGQWNYKATDRNAQASENIAAGQNASNLVLGMANNERMRDGQHLEHKAQRSKMLLDTWTQGRAINASLYAPVGGYNSFA